MTGAANRSGDPFELAEDRDLVHLDLRDPVQCHEGVAHLQHLILLGLRCAALEYDDGSDQEVWRHRWERPGDGSHGSTLRASDAMGRYGGEEFVVVAPDCTAADAMTLADRFRTAVCAEPIEVGNGVVTVTMSLGAAATRDMDLSDQLLRAADEALYKAKQGGRNRIVAGTFE